MPGKPSRHSATKISGSTKGKTDASAPVSGASRSKTAPLLPDELAQHHQIEVRSDAKHVSVHEQHTKRKIRVRHHATRVARTAAKHYKTLDTKAVHAAKRSISPKLHERIQENRAQNNGNLRVPVAVPKTNKKFHFFIPEALKHIRHAAVPVAVAAVLVLTILPAGAAVPVYDDAWSAGGTGSDVAHKVATDGSDNVYIAGVFEGSVDFGTDWGGSASKTSSGGSDIFVVKQLSDGTQDFVRRIGGSGSETVAKIVTDSSGNVFLTGTFSGTVNFAADWSGTDSKASTGSTDVFVTKINSDGTYGWTRIFGDTGAETAGGLAVDTSGNIYAAGSFTGTVMFDDDFGGSADSKSSAGSTDAFVTKINSDNTYGWTHIFGDTTADTGDGVAWQSGGTVLVSGSFTGTVVFDDDFGGSSDSNASAGDSDAFVAAITDAGAYSWSRAIGGSGADAAMSITADASASYVTGSFTGSVTFDADFSSSADSKTSAGTTDAFVTKINDDGTYGWTRQIGASGAVVTLHDVIRGTGDELYLASDFDQTVDFAGDTAFSASDSVVSAGSTDGALTQITTAGAYGWTRAFGDTTADAARGVAYDTSDTIHLVGDYTGTVNFAAGFSGTDNKTSAGNEDGFIVKLAPAPVLHTITDAAGLTYEDASGTNLSSTGTATTNPDVYVRDQDDGTVLAVAPTDLSVDRDWSTLSGDSNVDDAMFLSGAATAPGASGTYDLYVPREATDTAVYVCPDATALGDVALGCANLAMYTTNDSGVSTTTHDGGDYFVVADVTDDAIGAQSLEFPPALIAESSGDTAVAEGGAGDYVSVSLQAAPTDDVTVSFSTSPGGQIDAIDPVTFTTGNWATPVQVSLDATDDASIEGAHAATLSYAMSSTDPNYDGNGESAILNIDITDDDTAGINWSAPDTLTGEDGDMAELCVTLTAQPTDPVTLSLQSTDTSEITIPSSVNVAVADWDAGTNCVTASGVDDDLTDGAIQADIEITAVTSDDTDFSVLDPGTLPSVTLTNQDDDAAGYTVTPSATDTGEDGTSVNICIELAAQPASGSVTVPVSVDDGSEGSVGAGSIVIAAADWDQPTNCVTVTGEDDDVVDGDIGYNVVTGDPTAGDPVWDATDANDVADVGLTNLDDDTASFTVTETTGSTDVSEAGTTDQLEIAISSQPASGQEVVLYVQPNSQIDIGQGAGQPTNLTFTEANWGTPQAVTVSAVDDSLVEDAHTASVTVGVDGTTTETPYQGLSDQTINDVAVTDNDTAEVSIANQSDATENPASNGTFLVSLSATNNTGGAVNVSYSVGGTAAAGTHYAALSSSVAIADGQNSAQVTVDVSGLDNALLEGDLSVIATLTGTDSPVVSVDGTADEATVLIFDDETAEVSLAATQNGQESGTVSAIFAVTLDTTNNTGSPISVTLSDDGGTATAGSDYTAFAGTVDIADGASSAQQTVTVADDGLFEAENETVNASISNPSLGAVSVNTAADTAQATILDDETATATVANQSDAAENPASDGAFTVSLDKTNNTGAGVDVTYNVSGSAAADGDYDALSGTVTVANGQQTADVAVTTSGYDDVDMEGDETVALTLTGSGETRVTVTEPDDATVTISDDETAGVTVAVTDATTSESGATGEFCVTLASRPAGDVTIALSSEDSSKVSVSASLVVAQADWNTQANNCVTFTGVDDTPPQATGNQTVTIFTTDVTSTDTFYDALGAGDVDDIDVTHVDNDTAGVNVQSISTDTSEDGGTTATVRFSLDTQPSSDVTLPLGVSDASEGSLGGVTDVTFTSLNWDDPMAHEVTISGVDDDLIDGNVTYDLQTGDVTSVDGPYDALGAGDVADVTLTNLDDDTAAVSITPDEANPTIAEGGVVTTHDVVIGTQPASGNEVVITATPSNGEIDLGAGAGNPATLTFTNANWGTPQTVTITPNDDALFDGTQSTQVVYDISDGSTTETPYQSYTINPDTFGMSVADNETVQATLSAANGDEDGPASMTFTASLDIQNDTGSAVTFTANPSGGNAIATDDYGAFTDADITVANGASSGQLQVTVVDDDLLEGDETLEATLTAVDNPAVSLSTPTDNATIADNDTTAATIAATDDTAAENPASSGEFTVSLARTNNTGSAIAVDYSVTGTATSGSDYAALSGSVAIADGQAGATISVDTATFDDDLIEGNETVIVTLDSTDHALAVIGAPAAATVTISDDDQASVSITPAEVGPTITEGSTTTTHDVVIGTQPAGSNVVVVTATPNNSEINLGAGAGNPASLTFDSTNWDTPQTVTITPNDDALFDGTQAAQVTYDISDGPTTETPYQSYTVSDGPFSMSVADDESAQATLTATDGDEDGPASMTFTATLDIQNDTGSDITFTANTSDGSATATDDYASFTDADVVVTDGASSGQLQVAVVDDGLLEGDETLEVTLTAVDNPAVSITTPTDTATIADNDVTQATIVATTDTAAENPSGNGEFTVYLDHTNMTGQPITVDYGVSGTATAGTDYAALSGSVNIAAGQSSATVSVNTSGLDDSNVEGNETVIVTLQSTDHGLVSVGSPSAATVTIADDDGFVVNLSASQDGSEVGPADAEFTVALSAVNETGTDVTVELAENGGTATVSDDYTSFATTVSIPDGQQSVQVTVPVVDDSLLEDTETIGASIANPSDGVLGVTTATADIADNESGEVTVAATDADAVENPAENGEFTISLGTTNSSSEPVLVSYTVNGTATGGDDYAALSGTANIASGQNSTVVNVDVTGKDDSTYEGDETVALTLTNADFSNVSVGDPASATVTIADDETEPEPDDSGGNNDGGDSEDTSTDDSNQTVTVIISPGSASDSDSGGQTPKPATPEPQPVDQVADDRDEDGIGDEEEAKAHNHGDGNGDGIPDSRQAHVASRISAITDKPVTLEVVGECTTVTQFEVIPESVLTKSDNRFKYPHGLVDYTLKCTKQKQAAQVTIYYDSVLKDTGSWRKFTPGTEQFAHIDSVEALTKLVGTGNVTTATYSIIDGDSHDDDGQANGEIRDPAGFAVRTFYIWDFGWILPVLLAAWFIGHSIHHRHKDYKLQKHVSRF